jgi:pimeloyl-ACP methyl ester carboxylesterase
LFGGRSIERDNFITVRHVSADAVSLGSGLVHGLRPGTEVALYPADIKSREDLASRPMATAVVTSVQATTAQASLLQPLTSPLTAGVRALITRQVYEGIRQTVALHQEGAPDGLVLDRIREAICHSTPDGGPSPYLSLVDSPHQTVDLHVKLEDGVARILNANGELLLLPEQLSTMGPDAGVKIRQALESVARYRSLQQLTNREAGSQIVGKVKLGLRRYLAQATGYTAEELPAQAYGSGGELTIQYDAEHPDRNLYSVTVANLSPLPIYPHIFILGPDFSIQRLYPRLGQQEFVPPGHTVSAGLDSPQEVLEMYLPEGWNASRDYVKLIATTTPTDLGSLEQTALSVPAAVGGRSRGAMQPLDQLLEAVAFGGGTRHARPNRTATTEDWATAELPLTTVRSEQITQLDLPAARVDLGDGITLVKPEGFQGQVRVTTQGNVARGMGDRGPARVPPPPGLARFPGIFQPVARIGTRGIGPTELLVEFELDEESRRSVSEDRPLRLELPSPAGDGYSELVPVMFDGEDYLLVGYGTEEGSGVDLVSLPAPVAAPENEISTRSITGTLRLFLYKKAGKNSTELGLRRPRLSGEDLTYEEVTPDQFQQGQKVAILIHGFTSNTQGIAKIFPHFAEEYGLTYDHVLTWDYETFGTGVHDNGKLLATALKQRCGLHPDDDITIHIFAHSMGSLVSRCLIELEGGHEIIDRLIMAGPPNQGSPMASMTRGVVFFFTTLINFAGVIPPIGVANWALKSLFEQGVGLSDISLKSPISQELNTLAEPNNVPYLVLAGTNPLSEEANARMERLAHKMMGESLEKIFRETNDRWVGISSLQGVRNGSYPQLTVELVPCDHNHYYVTPEGRQSMKQWLDQ